jgi:hypothetical protein
MIHTVIGHGIQDHLHNINVMYFEPFLDTCIKKVV